MAKMLAATQILSMVIRPALSKINLWSPNAEELVLGLAIVESGLTYIRQWGGGPALGLWQVEPSTQNRDLCRCNNKPAIRRQHQRLFPFFEMSTALRILNATNIV